MVHTELVLQRPKRDQGRTAKPRTQTSWRTVNFGKIKLNIRKEF
jgi:hypothetical protein